MSFKIPDTPTAHATIQDYADFLELMCIFNDGPYSITNATKKITYSSDELEISGVNSEDDAVLIKLQDALGEIDNRMVRCNNRYPFTTSPNNIEFNIDCIDPFKSVYIYLLFATRNNMTRDKMKGGVNGTLLFEEISAQIIKEYWGHRSQAFAFGTSKSGGFRSKVSDLSAKLKEGGSYKDPEGTTHDEKDGGLDIVVWKPFSDDRKSKLIGFGQCKTGTEWKNEVGQLQPKTFFDTYLSEAPFLDPVTIFFTSEVCFTNYEKIARKAGLFFDRCRLMDFMPNELPNEIFDRLKIWTQKSIEDLKKTI